MDWLLGGAWYPGDRVRLLKEMGMIYGSGVVQVPLHLYCPQGPGRHDTQGIATVYKKIIK